MLQKYPILFVALLKSILYTLVSAKVFQNQSIEKIRQYKVKELKLNGLLR